MERGDWVLLGLFGLGALVGGLAVYVLSKRSEQALHPPVSSSVVPSYAVKPVYSNEETWTWADWKGRERKITVKRNVKERV